MSEGACHEHGRKKFAHSAFKVIIRAKRIATTHETGVTALLVKFDVKTGIVRGASPNVFEDIGREEGIVVRA
jgi:hypothetical protein